MIKNYPKLKEAQALDNFNLLLLFSNGEKKLFDFTANLSHPYFKNLQSPALFRNVTVKDGEIEWATGQDFCPHMLYEKSVRYTE